MKKVFVSVAVRGLSEEETIKKHLEYEEKITNLIGEYEDISNNVSGFHSNGGLSKDDIKHPAIYWFGNGLSTQMCNADLVIFCGDISNTRGCKIEKMICEIYDIPHLII